MDICAFLVILAFVAICVVYFVLHRSRMIIDNCTEMNLEANIVAVRSQTKGNSIKTIVHFSDGSEYHTYFTGQAWGLTHSRIYIDEEVLSEIKEKAYSAHDQKAREEKYKKLKSE